MTNALALQHNKKEEEIMKCTKHTQLHLKGKKLISTYQCTCINFPEDQSFRIHVIIIIIIIIIKL